MPTARERDDNGFMSVVGCPISSFGIFDYSAGQLGLPGDPNRIVKVFRPESAVSDPDTLDSFKNVPFIVDHEMLSGFEDDDSAEAPDDYGVDGVLTGNVYYDAPWMRGDIKIFSRRAQRALAQKKRDLSLGYSCDFEIKPGVFNGQPYEVVQTNMRGNHIALVDEGRVPGAKVLDGQSIVYDHLNFDVRPSDKETTMKRNKKAADNAVAQLKALLPALEQFLNEEATEPAHQEGAEGAGAEGAEGEAATTGAEAGATQEAAGAEAGAAEGEGEGGENEGDGAADLPSVIAQIESILAELKANGGEGNEGEAGNEGSGADIVEGLRDGEGEGANANGEGASGAGEANDGEGEGSPVGEGQGKASPGPAAGKHTEAADASVRRFYADLAVKDSLYNRLSSVVGAFDSKSMDARAVAAYGVKKLKLKVASGQEMVALDAYLGAVEQARRDSKTQFNQRAGSASDSALPVSAEVDAYIKG